MQTFMDLRDRDNLEQAIAKLGAVSDFKPCERMLVEQAAKDAALNAELHACKLVEMVSVNRAASAIGASVLSTLRIHVFHAIQTLKDGTSEFMLRLDGKHSSLQLSDFVSKLKVQVHPTGEALAWTRSATESIDGISLTRRLVAGEAGANQVEITIHVDYKNCLLPLPLELQTFNGKGVRFMDFLNLFKLICNYIRANKLSSNDDPSYFTPDTVLHKILYPNHPKNHPVSFASLLEVVRAQIKAPGPFKIVHLIDPAQSDPTKTEQVFDITVQVPEAADDHTSTLLDETEKSFQEKLLSADTRIAQSLVGLDQVTNDAKFLDRLARNPVAFLQEIITNPTGTVANVPSAGLIDFTQMSTSHEFYRQPWAVAAAAHVVGEQRKAGDKSYM